MSIRDKAAAARKWLGSISLTSKSKRLTIGFVAAIAAVAVFVVPTTGANFTASDTGRVDVSTANLSLSLTDDNASAGTFNLNFPNVAPGTTIPRNFYVTNAGSVPANVKIGQPVSGGSLTIPAGQSPNLGQLRVGITGHYEPTPVTALPPYWNLGQLAPGQSAGFTVNVSLDSNAGNAWQNVVAGADVMVILEQA